MPQKAKPQKAVSFKKGDTVRFAVSHGKVFRQGSVVAILKPDEFPDLEAKAFKGFKKPGFNNAQARSEKSYLVLSDGILFWPKSVAAV